MNHVFATYFRVIKRLPMTNLLEPVLEGLAKFAHLINVEFFDDMISALSSLISQQVFSFSFTCFSSLTHLKRTQPFGSERFYKL